MSYRAGLLYFLAILTVALFSYFVYLQIRIFANVETAKLYVSTDGNDAWSGRLERPNSDRTDGPLATIDRAKNVIRERFADVAARPPVVIYVKSGTYYLNQPLQFEANDSGKANTPIYYRSLGSEPVIISGGKKLTLNWQAYRDGIFEADLSGQNLPDSFTQLFVNNKRAVRARTPNIGQYHRIAGVFNEAPLRHYAFKYAPGDIDPSWTNIADIEVVPHLRWLQPHLRVARIDQEAVHFTGTMSQLYDWDYRADGDLSEGGQARYFVENVMERLDSPGEWYYNKQTKKLYYQPLAGEDINQAEIIVPVLNKLVDFNGQANPLDLSAESFTVSLKIKTGVKKPQMYALGNSAGGNGFRFGLSDGKMAFMVGNSSPDQPERATEKLCGNIDLADDRWHQIIFSLDRTFKRASCSSSAGDSQEISLPDNYFPETSNLANREAFAIGKPPCCQIFEGAIDDLLIFKKAFNGGEVENLLSNNSAADRNNLLLSLNFDDNGLDQSGRGNNFQIPANVAFVDSSNGKAVNIQPGSDPITLINQEPRFVEHIVLNGFTFRHNDWPLSPIGYYGFQSGERMPDPPMINISGARQIELSNNTFELSRANAVELYKSEKISVQYNEFKNLGGGAIRIASGHANAITDNVIQDTGQIYAETSGIFVQLSGQNHIAYNAIQNTPCSGIAVGWNWNGATTPAAENVIEHNDISNAVRVLNDCGGVYLVGRQYGTLVRHNKIHDIYRSPLHATNNLIFGIQLDHRTEGVKVENNLVYRAETPIALGMVKSNLIANNTLVDAKYRFFWNASGRYDEGDQTADNEFINNILVSQKHPGAELFYDSNSESLTGFKSFGKNVYFGFNDEAKLFWQGWRGRHNNLDQDSIEVDPLLKDYAADDFRLSDNSPAFNLGIKAVDWSSAKPRNKPNFNQLPFGDNSSPSPAASAQNSSAPAAAPPAVEPVGQSLSNTSPNQPSVQPSSAKTDPPAPVTAAKATPAEKKAESKPTAENKAVTAKKVNREASPTDSARVVAVNPAEQPVREVEAKDPLLIIEDSGSDNASIRNRVGFWQTFVIGYVVIVDYLQGLWQNVQS